ncbi:MAG: DUF1833 family protein [Alphaproteobacteria bacterium]
MSRPVSAAFKRAVFASQTGEAFILLVTIDHPSLATPLRVTSDGVATVSNGETFERYPFRVELVEDSEDALPRMRLSIDNVDREIVQALRDAGSEAPTVTVQLVLGSDPDTIEAEFPDFRLGQGDWDVTTVDGELTLDDLTALPYPFLTYTPSRFPGLFR